MTYNQSPMICPACLNRPALPAFNAGTRLNMEDAKRSELCRI